MSIFKIGRLTVGIHVVGKPHSSVCFFFSQKRSLLPGKDAIMGNVKPSASATPFKNAVSNVCGAKEFGEAFHSHRFEFIMGDSHDDAIRVMDVVKVDEFYAIFAFRVFRVCHRVDNKRLNTVFLQLFENVVYLGISCVGAILLEGDSQNDHLAVARRFVGKDKLLNRGVGDKGAHAVVDNTTVENNLAMVA